MREELLRVKEVAKMFSVSPASIWNWVNDKPHFPKPAKITPKVTVWKLSELNKYIDEYVFDGSYKPTIINDER